MPFARFVKPNTCVFLSIWLGAPWPARALPPTPGVVDTFIAQVQETCGSSPQAEHFIQALRVELGAAPFTLSDLTATNTHSCDPEHGVVKVQWHERELTLDVSDVPPAARPRTLAVAFAETLRLPPPAPVSPPATQAPPPTSVPTRTPLSSMRERATPPKLVDGREPTLGFQVPVSVRTLLLGPEQTLAIGANAGLSFPLAQELSFAVHVGYLTARHRSALGQARLHAGTVEGTVYLTILRPSAHSTVDLGVDAAVYRALVVIESAWGIDEPNVDAWFALWGLHASLSTVLSDHVRVFTRIGGVKDLLGLSLSAGGEKAMSFYGFGAELRLGAGYAW